MTPLRVAVDATSLFGARTGVGRFTTCLLEELAVRDDVQVTAFAVTWRGGDTLSDLLPEGIAAARGASKRMAARPLRELWRRVDHPRIERWTGPIDLVHGPNFVVPPARATRVVTIHDLTFEHFPEFCTTDVLQYPALIRRALRGGAWVHTDSSFVRNEVIEVFGADPDRVVAVPLGVTPPPSLDPAAGRARAGSDTYVLALGTIEPRKNLPTLVRAFDRLAATHPDLRLVVAGPDGWGVDAYLAAVAAAHHRERIVRLGFVTEAERGDLIAGASVVAVPSYYEGFGLSAAEAMLAGTPVVASDAGSHPEVVGDAGLLVPHDDPDEIAAAIDRVLTDAALAAALRHRGPARAQQLTWPTTAAGIVTLYQRAVGAE